MDKSEFEVRKKGLLLFLEGQKMTNELVKAEKRRRLSQLAAEDSLLEYDALCNTWESPAKKEGITGLERQRIFFLLKRRERLNKAGGPGEGK